MSAISTDWAPPKIAPSTTLERKRSREEVFHSALESYIASYRKRHTAPVEVARRSPWLFLRLMNWSRR